MEIIENDRKKNKEQVLPVHIEHRSNPVTGRLEYHCNICQKTFESRTQKYYHYNCNNDEPKKYKCLSCMPEKSFATRSHLLYHQETHNTMTYECEKCHRSFTNRIVYQKHLKIHQRTTTFQCPYCDKEFVNKETLATHKARHNNELHFECEVCKTKYASKSALEQHRLSHFEKKHECPECGKRFQRNSILNLHLKRHKKTDLHVCTIEHCSKKFSDMSTLQRHIKMHKKDGLKKYRCIQCDIVTHRKDNMQRHVRNMHTGEEFCNCVEIVSSIDDNNERNIPKTVANSTVIKCIGNVEPVKVPNLIPQNRNSDSIETGTVQEVSSVRTKKVKKKYDPIEMYRKIIGTEDDNDEDDIDDDDDENINGTESLRDKQQDATVQITEKPRSTTVNMSNFSETHWRKNFKYTYQRQEY